MGDGTEQNPYTREDVLRLIEENGGKAEGLDLSGKVFEHSIDFQGINRNDFQKIILKRAYLRKANLKGANLTLANLEGADLWEANLEGANLGFANLEGANLLVVNLRRAYLANANLGGVALKEANLESANLFEANLEGADLRMANLKEAVLVNTNLRGATLALANLEEVYLVWSQFSTDTEFQGASWGNYILGEEKRGDFNLAKEAYWQLRHWHTNAGMYGIAAKFYFREKEVARKGAERRRDRVAGWLSWAFFGHGEGWKRILIWIAGIIVLFALIYFALGTLTPNAFLDCLYYSAVSFTAVGYGGWVKESVGLVKGLGVFETFLGFFMMTLLLVTFVRKWTR